MDRVDMQVVYILQRGLWWVDGFMWGRGMSDIMSDIPHSKRRILFYTGLSLNIIGWRKKSENLILQTLCDPMEQS